MLPDLGVFHVLQRHGVPFVIIGGHAVNLHGYARATEDADAVWLRSEDSEHRLLSALVELDARYLGKQIDPTTGLEKEYPISLAHIRSHHLMMLWTRFGFLDLFDYIPGYPDADVNLITADAVVDGGLQFVSREWIEKLKRASGRPKDLDDLEGLANPDK